tara:strand:- start:32 stop:325 length:294 start_codon:yes stop_codon:yes gene_type:complete
MADNETVELMRRMQAELAEAAENIRAKYEPMLGMVAGQMLPDPVGDAMLAADQIGKAGQRLNDFIRPEDDESDEFVGPTQQLMRMDGMGAGPRPTED